MFQPQNQAHSTQSPSFHWNFIKLGDTCDCIPCLDLFTFLSLVIPNQHDKGLISVVKWQKTSSWYIKYWIHFYLSWEKEPGMLSLIGSVEKDSSVLLLTVALKRDNEHSVCQWRSCFRLFKPLRGNVFYLSSGPQYLLLMGGEIELRWENKRQQMHANSPECAA